MSIGITMLQHTVYKQSSPICVDDMDPRLDHYSGLVLVIQYNTFYRSLSCIVIVPSGTYSSFSYPLFWNIQIWHKMR